MRIKKIKQADVEALGDEWTVATEEEVTESGITLGEGEVLVYETPEEPQSNDSAIQAELTTLRNQVRKANRESASRRISLRDTSAERERLAKENEDLKKATAERAQQDKKTAAQKLFADHITEKKHAFISDVAQNDIQNDALAAVDWTKDVTKEVLGPIIDGIIEKKPYVIKTVDLGGGTGGGKGNNNQGQAVMDDEFLEDVARSFNIPHVASSKKE